MFRLELVKDVNLGVLIDADFSYSGKLAVITRQHEVCSLVIEDETWFSWDQNKMPHLRHARWMGDNRVAIWSTPTKIGMTDAVLACSASERKILPIGLPTDLLFGESLYFVCFGEDQFLRAPDSDIESNMIAVFDGHNKLIFGLRDFVNDITEPNSPTEMRVGCVTQKDEGIFAFNALDVLWRIDAASKSVIKIAFPLDISRLLALSASEDRIVFVMTEESGFRFGYITLKTGGITFVEEVAYSTLRSCKSLGGFNRRDFRVRGCRDGAIMIAARSNVWRVYL
jgi:hypothetical protein